MINNWPADKIEKRDIETLIPYARNAKKHPEAQLLKIAASIKEWGWTNPVLIDSSGGIIAGHGRVAAAQKLGIKEIPVMVAEGWSQAKIKAYCIADNKLAESEWDEELLALELQELGEMDFDLELLGFDETELDLLLGDGEQNKQEAQKEFNYEENYSIIITCKDDLNQTEIYDKLVEQGYDCKVLVN